MRRLLEQADEGFSAVAVDPSVRSAARAALKRWSALPDNAADLDQVRWQLAQGRADAVMHAFGGRLAFGTGGCRGRVGLGPALFNPATLATLIDAHARWLLATDPTAGARGVVVAFDTRRFVDVSGAFSAALPLSLRGWSSEDFARLAARVYGGHGIPTVMPQGRFASVGLLSFAVRALGASAGLYLSASHNPPDDNGAKLYDASGCQLVPPLDAEVADFVCERAPVEADGLIRALEPSVWDRWEAHLCEVVGPLAGRRVVYTALHGVGTDTVVPALRRAGVHVTEVVTQASPDPAFSTIPGASPNPENRASLATAMAVADRAGVDLVLGTDPDADRLGVAARCDGAWRVLSGDEIACVLVADVAGRARLGALVVRTEVTSSLVSRLAHAAGLEVVDDLLVGFKFIGDLLNRRDVHGTSAPLAIAVEESHGILISSEMRDKDAAGAALLMVRASAFDVAETLRGLDNTLGPVRTGQRTLRLEGLAGRARVARIMAAIRQEPPADLVGCRLRASDDKAAGIAPRSGTEAAAHNVVVLHLEGARVTVRPSGTEPKLKLYIEAAGDPGDDAEAVEERVLRVGDAALRWVAGVA